MILKEELADRIIERLNEFADNDPEAINHLFMKRVPCNDVLAAHPTVQVRKHSDGSHSCSLLGILNGIVGIIDDRGPRTQWGLITAIVDEGDADNPASIKFARTNPNP